MLFLITEDNLVDYRHGKHTFIFCMFSYDNVVICLYTILVVGKKVRSTKQFPTLFILDRSGSGSAAFWANNSDITVLLEYNYPPKN